VSKPTRSWLGVGPSATAWKGKKYESKGEEGNVAEAGIASPGKTHLSVMMIGEMGKSGWEGEKGRGGVTDKIEAKQNSGELDPRAKKEKHKKRTSPP